MRVWKARLSFVILSLVGLALNRGSSRFKRRAPPAWMFFNRTTASTTTTTTAAAPTTTLITTTTSSSTKIPATELPFQPPSTGSNVNTGNGAGAGGSLGIGLGIHGVHPGIPVQPPFGQIVYPFFHGPHVTTISGKYCTTGGFKNTASAFDTTIHFPCITDKHNDLWKAWCATSVDPLTQKYLTWESCKDAIDICYGTDTGKPCQAFTYKGNYYKAGDCSYIDSYSARPWCALVPNYDASANTFMGSHWDFCKCYHI